MSTAREILAGKFTGGRAAVELPAPAAVQVEELPVDAIDGDPEQPRKTFPEESLRELGESLRDHGQLAPIRVRRAGTRYVVIAGERRLRASRLVGLRTIQAVIVDARASREQLQIEQIIENTQREDVDPLEQAAQYAKLLRHWGCSQAELARRVGKHPGTISRSLALLEPAPAAEAKPAKPAKPRGQARDKRKAAEYVTDAGTARVKRGRTLAELVAALQELERQQRAA